MANFFPLFFSLLTLCPVLNCSVPVISFGRSNASLVQDGAPVQFTCQHGYFLWGKSSATCNGDGSLSSVPSCYSKLKVEMCILLSFHGRLANKYIVIVRDNDDG